MIYNDLTVPGNAVIRADPFIQPATEDDVQLRLTYEGVLLGASRGNTRSRHKHELRKCFHKQLKRFWEIHPALKEWFLTSDATPSKFSRATLLIGERYERCGHNFVPLVLEQFSLSCAVSILMLRPDLPGSIIQSGDLDNRLKTIFDALRIPASLDELGGYEKPADDEKPFYCLLENDALVTHVTVETDTLLEPVSDAPNQNDARLIIKVELKPYFAADANAVFN